MKDIWKNDEEEVRKVIKKVASTVSSKFKDRPKDQPPGRPRKGVSVGRPKIGLEEQLLEKEITCVLKKHVTKQVKAGRPRKYMGKLAHWFCLFCIYFIFFHSVFLGTSSSGLI